jgi:arylsulfatase A-like enzyme
MALVRTIASRDPMFAFLVAVVATLSWPYVEEASARQPNVVFILADDLGHGDLSCYGQRNFKTPRIDRMASEGLRFTQHYAGSTVCAPSRASLLTGQHTGHVYQRGNDPVGFRADPLDRCVAWSFRQGGYATAMIGKSGLSCAPSAPGFPNEKGFDHFFGFLSHGAAHRYYPTFLHRNGKRVAYEANRGKEGEAYSGDLFLDDALAWIEQHKDKPFFLHLALQQPHLDLAVPERWKKPYLGRFEETPLKGGGYRAESHPKATFAGMISHLDHSVGAILDKLDALAISEDTLVLFASDNGAVTAAGWECKNFDSNGPLRGCKRDLYEGGIRVPMIARWHGTIRAGRTTGHVSAFWDFVPTMCELADLPPPGATDGISYLPTLLDKGEQQQHEHLYWEFYEQGGKQAVRMGDWKGVRLDVLTNPAAAIELYNLAADPSEHANVAGDHVEIAARLLSIMEQEHVPTERYSFRPANRESAGGDR